MELIITNRKGEQFTVLYDECDHNLICGYSWHVSKTGYASGKAFRDYKSKIVLMHRLVLGLVVGDGKSVDHRDFNRLDNRRENIRVCSLAENNQNTRLSKRNTSGYKGASWNSKYGKWECRIALSKKCYFVGYFKTREEAARAYDQKAKELFGEFARLNFPNE